MTVFVRATNHHCANWGVGKLLSVSNSIATISWFDSPLREPHIEHIDSQRLTPVILEPQTRVYWLERRTGIWHVGRVRDADDMRVEVRFANRRDLILSLSDIEVRWDHPIDDPSAFLAAQLNESPQFAQARSRFNQSLIAQRGASSGMSAFISSIIDLEPHQYEVVKRVLQDPIQRYLLADEVGLGKTIEAAVLIRQYVLDNPHDHDVSVIVPPALVLQWRRELRKRFLLGDLLDDSLHVLPNNASPQELRKRISKSGMVVVDEAHHLTRIPELYAQLRDPIIAAPRLLLLSATPVLHNERGFLEMLHLLDPDAFRLSDELAFRRRIEHRQALAESVAGLIPENLFQIEDFLDDLLQRFPDDPLLTGNAEQLRNILNALPDESDPEFLESLTRLRAHLTETYRLDRRILRNRRRDLPFLTPRRTGVSRVDHISASSARLIQAVEDWRRIAAEAVYGVESSTYSHSSQKWFHSLLDDVFSGSTQIGRLVRDRLTSLQAFPGSLALEGNALAELASAAVQFLSDNERLEALRNLVERQLQGEAKLVIFCSKADVADSVAEALERRLSAPIDRHIPYCDAENDSEEQTWERFLSDPSHRVIVCDAAAEEGLNLQGGEKIVIHYDLPLSPNRIEQRLGRADRNGSGDPIPSFALTCRDDPYGAAWFAYLDEGLKVFDRSVASLQYLIEQEMESLGRNLFLHGVEAFHELTERSKGPTGSVERELRRIDDQDALDALALPEQQTDFEALSEIDNGWREITDSLQKWIVDTLQVDIERAPGAPSMPFGFGAFRFCFSYRERGHNTLIPLRRILSALLQVLDPQAVGAHSRLLKTRWFTCRRGATRGSSSSTEGIHLFRWGDILVDRIQRITSLDDRGRAAAMWRHHREHSLRSAGPADLFLRIDFLVEADAIKALSESALSVNPNVLKAVSRRADMFFPPFYKTIWLNEEASPLTDPELLKMVEAPYRRAPDKGAYQDWNVNAERWPVVKGLGISAVDVWSQWIPEARRSAEYWLREETSLEEVSKQSISRAKEVAENRFAQLRARLRQGDDEGAEAVRNLLENEQRIAEALESAILRPRITVGTIMAVFLSPHPLAEFEAVHG